MIQKKKLKTLINHAYENVPYYRNLFDSVKLKPMDIHGVEDLKKVPITDKSVLRAMDLAEVTANNIKLADCIEVFTSGSTGMPTHIYLTREDYMYLDLVYLRSFLENGLSFKHKRAFILDPHSFGTKKRWYHSLGLAKNVNISCFLDPQEQLLQLQDTRPNFIHGYPSSLSQVSRLILENRIEGLSPAMVSTAAELFHEKDREIITTAFGVRPYDRYAARECGNIAWECDQHNGYHINIDTLVVEFIKDGYHVKPGEWGDVVVTNLHSYAMPFIRYRIGDIGVQSDTSCPCGLEYPMMKIIEGRDEDFIVLKDGRKISPMMVTCTLDYVPGIRQFKVVQEEDGLLSVQLAKGKDFSPDTPEIAKTMLTDLIEEQMEINVQVVNEIPKEMSGKVRAVVSKLSRKY